MRKQLAIYLTTLLLLTGAAPAPAPAPAQQQPPDPGEVALAERMAQLAQTSLTLREINDITLREAAVLLEAASKLNPYEPRFPRLRAEACLSLRDRDGAMDALKAYSALEPSDQVAQVQMIDLYAAGLQAADAKLDYYRSLLKLDRLSPDVKAHVGARLARDLFDRGQIVDSKAALADALKFSPLDPDALDLNEQFARDGTPRERINSLLALLRANPAQPAVAARLAYELADEGLIAEAGTWFSNSIQLSNKMGGSTGPQVFLDYLAEILISGSTKGMEQPLDAALTAQPSNAQAQYLKLMLVRRSQDKDAIAKSQDAARDALLERVYAAHRAATDSDSPTTKPAGELAERVGDLVQQAGKVKESKNEDAKTDFISAVTDLAWFQIYFVQQTQPALPLIEALKVLVPEDDPRFARLEGWALLVDKKPEESHVKLSAVAERDPLAAMGMIQLASADPARKEEVKSSAITLLNDNRSGLLGAMLADGLHDFGAVIEPSEAGKAIVADMAQFPSDWFKILDTPDRFYVVTCMPAKVSHAFDEPIYAEVMFQNVGPFDIAIGPKGTIRPDLWFDVNVRGPGAPATIAGAAYDRLGKKMVLHSGDAIRQRIRLDQPKLAQGLAQNPVVSIQLLFQQVVNPITGPTGAVAPGPGGMRVQVKRPVERAATPLNAKMQQTLQAALASGQPGDLRMRTMTTLATYASLYINSTDDAAKARGKELAESMEGLTLDASPPVATWAQFLQISLKPPEKRGDIVVKMVGSNYWAARLLGANALLGAGASAKEVLMSLGKDEEPLVAKFSAAALDDLAHPTSQPTTAPAEGAPVAAQAPAAPAAPAMTTPTPSLSNPLPAPTAPEAAAPSPAPPPAPIAPAPASTAPSPAPAPAPTPESSPAPSSSFKL